MQGRDHQQQQQHRRWVESTQNAQRLFEMFIDVEILQLLQRRTEENRR
jgi:hypothetical protein